MTERAPLEPPDLDAIRKRLMPWLFAIEHKRDLDALLAHIEAQDARIAELEREQLATKAHLRNTHGCDGGAPDHDAPAWMTQLRTLERDAAKSAEQQSEIDRLRELLGASHTVLTDADSITSLVAYRHHRGRCDKGHPWELPSDVVDDLKATSTRARGLSERIEAVLSERPK